MDNIQALFYHATDCLGSGNLKSSYELYLQALDAALYELHQIKFVDQYALLPDNKDSLFTMAKTCLENTQTILNKRRPTIQPPPVPPKPLSISERKQSQNSNSTIHSIQTSAATDLTSTTMTTTFQTPPTRPTTGGVWKKMAQKPAAVIVPKKNKTSTTTSYTSTYTYTPAITTTPSDTYINSSTNSNDEDKRDEELKLRSQRLRRPSNASSVAPPSSPLVNPINAVKTFLSSSAPSAAVASLGTTSLSTSGGGGGNPASSSSSISSSSSNREDDFILMASGAVDPACLAPVQPSLSDIVTTANTSSAINTNIPSIPQAPLHIIYKSLQQKLENLERHNLHSAEVKQALNRVRHIHMTAHTLTTLLPFAPVLVAYQLTLIDSAIFRNIQPSALLNHHAPKSPHPAITASTDFFNYLTRVIEHAILTPSEASARAEQINFWIKVAIKCHDLKNFQTLKAIISALGTPPIQRLKRSWAYVPKKSMARLDVVNEIMTEHNNYERYRDRMTRIVQQTFREPVVPFLGVFMHDVTYLTSTSAACNVAKLDDLLTLFTNLHKHPPYSSALPPFCVKDLSKKQRKPFANESLEVQQCLVTQYLLTRSWVSEKTVDELSLLREAPKVMRSCSATDHTITYDGNLWSSSGSLLSFAGGSSSGNNNNGGSIIGSTSSASSSRPVSLESDEDDNDSDVDKQNNKFWVFGRKSVDHQHSHHQQSKRSVVDNNNNNSNSNVPMVPPTTKHLRRDRLSRHFSFEDLDARKHLQQRHHHHHQQQQQPTSLSIFRKDFNFWRKEQQDAVEPSSPQHPLDYDPVYKRNSVTLLERPIAG